MNRTSARLLAQNPQVLKRLAKYMALHCFRNTVLEDFHAGITPSSQAGVEVFQDRVAEAMQRHIFGQTLQDLWILGQKPCARAIHLPTPLLPSYVRCAHRGKG